MPAPHTPQEITTQIDQHAQATVTTCRQLSSAQFDKGTDTEWSPSGYLKHLILSVKPFARALELPKDVLEKRFGLAENSSASYDDLVKRYNDKLDAGLRAEMAPNVVPVSYKFPDNMDTDEQSYLINTWQEANTRLISQLEQWSEEELDRYQLPHPALGNITIREMCFFTIHHNIVHHDDIRRLAQST